MGKTGGKVKAIKKDGTAVCISNGFGDTWYDVTDAVKNFLGRYKIGDDVSLSIEESKEEGQNPLITFMGKDFKGSNSNSNFKDKAEYKTEYKKKEWNNFKNTMTDSEKVSMMRMSALKSASSIYQGSGQTDDFWKLVSDIIVFIETGEYEEPSIQKS